MLLLIQCSGNSDTLAAVVEILIQTFVVTILIRVFEILIHPACSGNPDTVSQDSDTNFEGWGCLEIQNFSLYIYINPAIKKNGTQGASIPSPKLGGSSILSQSTYSL